MSETPETGLAQTVIPEGAILMGSISIAHYMIDDDFQVSVRSQDSSGENIRIVTLLGLLETAKLFVSHNYMNGDEIE